MSKRNIGLESSPIIESCSKRIITLALAGILFLTLFPFRLDLSTHVIGDRFPLLLGGWGKDDGRTDAVLNILLFMPLGFGIAEKMREGGKPWLQAVCAALLGGFSVSYGVEFTQIYIPFRDSGWEDVITNTSGSLAGLIAFAICGPWVVRVLAMWDRRFASFLTLQTGGRRITLILILYSGLSFGFSGYMQMQTRLSNWWPDSWLLLGNDAAGRPGIVWQGSMALLQIWDRDVPASVAIRLTSGEQPAGAAPNLRAKYDFRTPLPMQDETGSLPDFVATSNDPKALTPAEEPARPDAAGLLLDGNSWFATRAIVPNLVADFRKTNQFAIQVVCTPGITSGSDGRIVSISERPTRVDLQVRQEDANLVLWFRNPMTPARSQLAWYIPGVFAAGQTRNIVVSYDGTDARVYLDGEHDPRVYRLGPGTGFARLFRMAKTSEVDGYNEIYYSLIFFPLGILLGFALRPPGFRTAGQYLALAATLLPALTLELILMWVSGRQMWFGWIALSMFLTIAGALWINLDFGTIPSSLERPSTA